MKMSSAKSGVMHYHVGTSGWTYDDWQGLVYPPGVSGAKRLAYYATLFDSVEVNATFYRFPSATMIAAWNRQLPKHFRLSIKGSRRISHVKELAKPELVQLFLQRVAQLNNARVMLWQMPPTRLFDAGYLQAFMRLIAAYSPKHLRHAIECRHPSWWTKRTYQLMAEAKMAFVCISHPELPDDFVQTTDVAYVRMHGRDAADKYRYNYSTGELAPWVKHLQTLGPKQDGYVFFNNDKGAHAVSNAQAFNSRLAKLASQNPR